jgi:hypothetical protein
MSKPILTVDGREFNKDVDSSASLIYFETPNKNIVIVSDRLISCGNILISKADAEAILNFHKEYAAPVELQYDERLLGDKFNDDPKPFSCIPSLELVESLDKSHEGSLIYLNKDMTYNFAVIESNGKSVLLDMHHMRTVDCIPGDSKMYRIRLSTQTDGIPNVIYIKLIRLDLSVKPTKKKTNSTSLPLTNGSHTEPQKDRPLKEELLSWVYECLGDCIRMKYKDAVILLPKPIVIHDILNSEFIAKSDKGSWKFETFAFYVLISNVKHNYDIYIVSDIELRSLGTLQFKSQKCFYHPTTQQDLIDVVNAITCTSADEQQESDEDIIPSKESITENVVDKPVESNIVDSGNAARVFESGFTRDSDDGKAKWSYLPPTIWDLTIPEIGHYISAFLMHGEVDHLECALLHLIEQHSISPLCDRYYNGALKYGFGNWAKLCPLTVFMDSLGRHAQSFYHRNEKDIETPEQHLGAIMWNLSGAIYLLHMIRDGLVTPTYRDIPIYKELLPKQ